MQHTCEWCLGHGRHHNGCPAETGVLDKKKKEEFLRGNLDYGTAGNQADTDNPSYLLGANMAEQGHIIR